MSKYLYPIYKLKTKSYIRWWLYNYLGKFNNYVLSEILTGTSFYLEDSTDRKFNIFDMIGRTTQDGNPTPKNPVPIKNTGDNGSVNEKVSNENLFDYENYTYDKTIFSAYRFIEIKNVESNTNYTIYNYNKALTGFDNVFFADDANYSSIRFGTQMKNVDSRQVTTNDLGKLYLCTYATSWNETLWNTFIKNFENAMFVEGTDISTSYVPHSEQNISFPLAQGQKLMEGDYLADDGVHHVRGEKDLGTLNFTPVNLNESARTQGLFSTGRSIPNMFKYGYSDIPSMLSNKYIAKRSLEYVSPGRNPTDMTVANYQGTIYVQNSDFSGYTNEQVKSALQGTILQYPLIEEVIDPYTEEQKTAWEQIKKARTYKPVTHISSSDETPAELKIQYWKEV